MFPMCLMIYIDCLLWTVFFTNNGSEMIAFIKKFLGI